MLKSNRVAPFFIMKLDVKLDKFLLKKIFYAFFSSLGIQVIRANSFKKKHINLNHYFFTKLYG